MCHLSIGKMVLPVNTRCGCTCGCPVELPVGDEIANLEEHRKIAQEQIAAIDRKISALQSVKEA